MATKQTKKAKPVEEVEVVETTPVEEVVVDTTVEVEETTEPATSVVVEEVAPVVEEVVTEEVTPAKKTKKKETVVETPVEEKAEKGMYIEICRAESNAVKTRLTRINVVLKDGKYVGPFATKAELNNTRMTIASVGIKTSVVEL